MDKHERAVMNGEAAIHLLNNPLFAQAFEDTRRAILEQFAALDRMDDKHAERVNDLHRMVKCLELVKRCLQVHVDTGKIAVREIEGRARRPSPLQGVRNAITNWTN